jgi:hypothetical protein
MHALSGMKRDTLSDSDNPSLFANVTRKMLEKVVENLVMLRPPSASDMRVRHPHNSARCWSTERSPEISARKSIGECIILYVQEIVGDRINNLADRKLFNVVILADVILWNDSMTFLQSFLSTCENSASISRSASGDLRMGEEISESEFGSKRQV